VLDDSKQYLVQTRLVSVLRAAELPTFAGLVAELRRRPHGQIAADVVEAMTTNETSFFRDVHPFDAVADHLAPAITARRPGATLTIWCGACSSGQEPYSLAIALAEHHPTLVRSGRVRILATDIAPAMVARCHAVGSPRWRSTGPPGAPPRPLVRAGRSRLSSARNYERSSPHAQLNSPARTGVLRCDIVWLRNVLIYFCADTKAQILARIRREVLPPGGHLFRASETTLNVDDLYAREIGRSIRYQTRRSRSEDRRRPDDRRGRHRVDRPRGAADQAVPDMTFDATDVLAGIVTGGDADAVVVLRCDRALTDIASAMFEMPADELGDGDVIDAGRGDQRERGRDQGAAPAPAA
jgi:chemotaxis protein methyltransferase CheR